MQWNALESLDTIGEAWPQNFPDLDDKGGASGSRTLIEIIFKVLYEPGSARREARRGTRR